MTEKPKPIVTSFLGLYRTRTYVSGCYFFIERRFLWIETTLSLPLVAKPSTLEEWFLAVGRVSDNSEGKFRPLEESKFIRDKKIRSLNQKKK